MPQFVFNPFTARWSGDNAASCAMAAELAYDTPSNIAATAAPWGFQDCEVLQRLAHDTLCFIASNAEMILVAFRGTDPQDLKNWMTDADLALVTTPVGMVHGGFWRALDTVWDDLCFIIKSQQNKAQSIWLTGHSLGAALATLATARFRLELDKPINGLYTFGSPRVGDRGFAARFNVDFKASTFRYVNDQDVVSRVPPRALLYSHVGTFLFFDALGEIHSSPQWWNLFLNAVEGTIDDFLDGKVGQITDHFVENYVHLTDQNRAVDPF